MEDEKKVKQIAKVLGKKPGISLVNVAQQYTFHASQVANLIARIIRNGDTMGLSDEELKNLALNVNDPSLTKVIQAKGVSIESAHDKSSSKAKQLADTLEDLSKKLHDRLIKGKPRSKLVNSKKTKIPGFSTYFRKE